MKSFSSQYFQKMAFTPKQIQQLFDNAVRDLKIAKADKFPEVQFTYIYQSLLKSGIALIAKHGAKVRSAPGHHYQILLKLSEILGKNDIFIIGNALRMKRNQDMYSGGEIITKKEIAEYLSFCENVVKLVEKKLFPSS
jgi:hypothetical protein